MGFPGGFLKDPDFSVSLDSTIPEVPVLDFAPGFPNFFFSFPAAGEFLVLNFFFFRLGEVPSFCVWLPFCEGILGVSVHLSHSFGRTQYSQKIDLDEIFFFLFLKKRDSSFPLSCLFKSGDPFVFPDNRINN